MGIPGYLPGYLSHVPYMYARVLDLSAKIRMREIELVTRKMASLIAENFRISQSRLMKGTNSLFASKDHVRPVSKWLCIIFMACSCPNFVLGCLKRKKKIEKIAVLYFRQFVSVIGYIVTCTRWLDT